MHDAKVQNQQYPWTSRLFLSPSKHEQYRALCERLGLPADRITQEHRNNREWQTGVTAVIGWPLLTELLESAGDLEVIVSQDGKAAGPRPDDEPQPWQAEFDEAGSEDPALADVMSEGDAKILEAHAEVEEALDRFRADQREGLEMLLSGKDLAEVALRSKIEADRLRLENEELRAEIRRLKTERAKNLAARAVDAQYRPNVTSRTNEVKPDEWQVFAAPAYPDRDDDVVLARFDFHSVDTDRRLRMNTVRVRFRGLAAFLLAFTPDGRYRNLALTKLEEAMFFANKGIAMEGR